MIHSLPPTMVNIFLVWGLSNILIIQNKYIAQQFLKREHLVQLDVITNFNTAKYIKYSQTKLFGFYLSTLKFALMTYVNAYFWTDLVKALTGLICIEIFQNDPRCQGKCYRW